MLATNQSTTRSVSRVMVRRLWLSRWRELVKAWPQSWQLCTVLHRCAHVYGRLQWI